MNCKNPSYIKVLEPNEEGKHKVLFVGNPYKQTADGCEELSKGSGYVQVPCGQCLACRINYSATWADRCYIESLQHEHTWFITLTYRDQDLVYGQKGLPTVEKDAISQFIRSLRDHYRSQKKQVTIRYFGCAEYGDEKGVRGLMYGVNPHYHIIVFGPDIDDLTINMPDMSKEPVNGQYPIFRRKNRNGDYVMWSKTIYDCWQKGKIEVEEASWNTAAYVSRYVVKKRKGKSAQWYADHGIEPEYIRMSNRPGIGADWLLYNKSKLLQLDRMIVKDANGARSVKPPRYFEKLMMKEEDSIDAQRMEVNKFKRQVNQELRCKESSSFKSNEQKRWDAVEQLEKKNKGFTRNLT